MSQFKVSFATLTGVLGSELSTASVEDCMWILHESQKSCSLLEMGTSPFLVRLRSRRSDKRTIAEHGDVPVRRSVHDCATSGESYTGSVSHASYQRSVGILGGETAKQYLPRAELSGFVRLATLRKRLRTQVSHLPSLSMKPLTDGIHEEDKPNEAHDRDCHHTNKCYDTPPQNQPR